MLGTVAYAATASFPDSCMAVILNRQNHSASGVCLTRCLQRDMNDLSGSAEVFAFTPKVHNLTQPRCKEESSTTSNTLLMHFIPASLRKRELAV